MLKKIVLGLFLLSGFTYAAPGPQALALLCAEGDTTCGGAVASFQSTGSFSSVDGFDISSSTPTLSQISGYGYVIAWTDYIPNNSVTVGNLLADYYDLGGKHLTIATYSFSGTWVIAGRVMTGNYVALTGGSLGDVSGNLSVLVPGDPIFSGLNLSGLTYSHNGNFIHPSVAMGATLLATDGAGTNMIARSGNGVVNVNLWPGAPGVNSANFYTLMARTLQAGPVNPVNSVPALDSTGMVVLGAALLSMLLYSTRNKLGANQA
jgi:hypothetical protein